MAGQYLPPHARWSMYPWTGWRGQEQKGGWDVRALLQAEGGGSVTCSDVEGVNGREVRGAAQHVFFCQGAVKYVFIFQAGGAVSGSGGGMPDAKL